MDPYKNFGRSTNFILLVLLNCGAIGLIFDLKLQQNDLLL